MKYVNPFHNRASRLDRVLDTIAKATLARHDAQPLTFKEARPIVLAAEPTPDRFTQEWTITPHANGFTASTPRKVCNNGGIAALIHGTNTWKGGAR